ncbi:metal homeostatis protein bsd2 [Westerdykella ornata]|uniref:Metal homeostatis protein bsd2 n=1 Tax=Westerdykella ornata TaxID=318751 RepID=A0A6A6JQ66_WESOR|nr:metal homeostatis protein bsd2 [Westerdykella ornata]KAF2278405.1 metal homeostatis protein bsd2 [Westerdykella ornata]
MPSQRYERISDHDEESSSPVTAAAQPTYPIPNSPPPSFHSRASSPNADSRRLLADDPLAKDEDRTLEDAFDSPSDDESDGEGDGLDDRQRLMRGQPQSEEEDDDGSNGQNPRGGIQRRVTQLPVFQPSSGATAGAGRIYGGGQNDGVWANLSAKPTPGEDLEEKPPTYEQAAADATPPYWETTILAPGTFGDEVYVEGLPVGSLFSFVWNAMISMSFQFVGFLLTYLLHTTHAAKNGSRAGLGITLVQWGFTMKSSAAMNPGSDTVNDYPDPNSNAIPADPNSHNFDPNALPGSPSAGAADSPASAGITSSDLLAYALMIVGWFILIKSVSDFIRARRHEQLVLQSPDRGLGTAVVAEGESPERSV